MNLNYLIWSPYGFATLDFQKKTNKETRWNEKKKNDTLKCFQTTSYIHLSIPLYIYLNIAISLVKRHIIASERDRIWKQALRYNTTSLNF